MIGVSPGVRGFLLVDITDDDWARLGPHEVVRARRQDTSNTDTLAEIRGELLEYGTAAETRKSIFLQIDG